MPSLHLLRHAKSSWDDPTLTDRSRPLNKRGRTDADALAAHFEKIRFRPALILCSPALRTRQTLDAIAPVLGEPKVVFDDAIYDGDEKDLLARLQAIGNEPESILLIGHNPGLATLALILLEPGQNGAAAALLREKYPTGTLASLSSPAVRWSDLAPASCRLTGFLRPRDIMGYQASS